MKWKLIVTKAKFEYDPLLDAVAMGRAQQILTTINVMFLGKIKDMLSSQGSGRIYPSKGGGTASHQASAPGEPPAPDLGAYRASWQGYVQKAIGGFELIIGSTLWAKFGRRLELGGHNGGPRPAYIAPRPHVRPTWDDMEDDVERLLED